MTQRLTGTKIKKIPTKFTSKKTGDDYVVVGTGDDISIGILLKDRTEVFLIPLDIFYNLCKVFADFSEEIMDTDQMDYDPPTGSIH